MNLIVYKHTGIRGTYEAWTSCLYLTIYISIHSFIHLFSIWFYRTYCHLFISLIVTYFFVNRYNALSNISNIIYLIHTLLTFLVFWLYNLFDTFCTLKYSKIFFIFRYGALSNIPCVVAKGLGPLGSSTIRGRDIFGNPIVKGKYFTCYMEYCTCYME